MAPARSSRLIAIGAIVCAVGVGASVVAVRAADATAPSTAADAPPVAAPADPDPASPTAADPEVRLPDPLPVPDRHEALAVQVAFDAGVAAIPGPGDHVNVYGVFTSQRPGEPAPDATTGPQVRRVLTGVQVLGVAGGTSSATGGSPTFVLAVTPDQAEQVVFVHTAERLWLTLVGETGPAPAGIGTDHGSILR